MKIKQYDWVFSVALSACIMISNLKNEDFANWDFFCDFYAF